MMAKEKQATNEKNETEEPKVKVRLNQSHTHARTPYKEGDEIDVPASTAQYMQEKGIATPV
jgi:molybdopterin converting factor small subunit